MTGPVKIEPAMILGSWTLMRIYETLDGKPSRLDPLGAKPTGFVHYLADGRMAVLIANDGRRPLTGGRDSAPEAELAEAARSFTAYGGTYTCGIDQVTHHLDITCYENDNHTDYVRGATFDGEGLLTLTTPQVETPEGLRAMSLVWRKLA